MKITDYIKNNLLVLDGGMGTLLQSEGLVAGEYPELWNLTHPETIEKIHRNYYEAGSNVVSTNTFGANSLKFDIQTLEKIISAAVDNAKKARSSASCSHEKFIALDIGPSGKLLKPYGDFDFEEAVEFFATTIKIGARLGVDLILIETMNDSYETKAALLAAKENCSLPVFVTNAYGDDGKLLTGADPSAMVALLEGMRADAIGVNCSLGPKQLAPVVREILSCASVPVILKPNAGLPCCTDGVTHYDVSPEEFADEVSTLIGEGVRIAGGCCGTTPEYISALSKRISSLSPVPITKKDITWVSSFTHAVKFESSPILIGERINPTGKKRFKQALVEHDIGYILQEGLSQKECGVQILDVNVGLPDIDEPSMLKETVTELQAILDLPLQIDTSDTVAMESALRIYNGRAMINSVNGKKESMEAIFPLAAKYGGLIVALTLDENGIPQTPEGRISIAKKIIAKAAEYGIDKNDLIFDPLAMTISADTSSALTTLKSLKLLREMGCRTSLGVSNVSFGLPQRDKINGTFFALALENGLSAAIMNPYSAPMMNTYYTYRALHDLDENCSDYIAYAESCPTVSSTSAAPVQASTSLSTSDELSEAIIKGLRERAGELTKQYLKSNEPMEIVKKNIIPALDIVGKGFEEKKFYLPQLLMSAEAAKYAFEEIKNVILAESKKADTKFTIVIATVEGDIHDIGKNIVRLLLENYGFNVIDLGKDVKPELVVERVKETHAPLVGLSALMTTTVPAMEKTIKLLRKEAPWCKVVVGGAVLNQEYADRIGADKYAKDAMEAVRYAESLVH